MSDMKAATIPTTSGTHPLTNHVGMTAATGVCVKPQQTAIRNATNANPTAALTSSAGVTNSSGTMTKTSAARSITPKMFRSQ